MATNTANDPQTEHAKKQLAEERKATERSRAEYAERSRGKPTPTQEELDLSMLGGHILEHEDDGSGPDPYQTKNLEAQPQGGKPANYQTRETKTTKHE